MLLDQLENQLIKLNYYESIGKRHRNIYGTSISHQQLMYLVIRGEQISNPEDLYLPEAIAEQKRIVDYYRQNNQPGILRASTFFQEGNNVEIQQLLRYVDIDPHQHDFVECAYVVTGKCIHLINDREYLQESGSFVAIPTGYSHALFPEEDCLCLTMKIKADIFYDFDFPGWVDFVCPLAFSSGKDAFVRNTIASIWLQQEKNLPYADQIMEQLFRTLMFYIEQNFRDTMQYLITGPAQKKQTVEILGFMADNYRYATLASVAEHFHYSQAYLSRLIRKTTDRTFSNLMQEYKLRQAAKLLSNSNQKLNEVCDAVGYKDTTQFIHNFKALYGITPGQYRKQAKQ